MWAGPEEGGFSHSEPRGNELAHICRGLITHNKASLLVGAQIKDGIFLSTASCRSSSSGYFIPLAVDDIGVVAMLSRLQCGRKRQKRVRQTERMEGV